MASTRRFQDLDDCGGEFRSYEAALVVAGFRPGVGEEDKDLLQARGRQAAHDEIERVAMQDTKVGEPTFLDEEQGAGDALGVDVRSDVVPLRVLSRGEKRGISEPGPDLKDTGGVPSEVRVEVEGIRRLGEVVEAAQFQERITLSRGQSSAAGVITADGFDHVVTLPIE